MTEISGLDTIVNLAGNPPPLLELDPKEVKKQQILMLKEKWLWVNS